MTGSRGRCGAGPGPTVLRWRPAAWRCPGCWASSWTCCPPVSRWDGLPPLLASPAAGFLLRRAQVGQEAVVVLAAGGAALQVRPQAGNDPVGVGSGELQLHV